MKTYEPEARAFAGALLDQLGAAGEMDLYRQFAQPLTIRVVCGILGIPPERTGQCRDWVNDFVDAQVSSPVLSDRQREEMFARIVAFDTWIGTSSRIGAGPRRTPPHRC